MKIFELLDSPGKWTQRAFARNVTGQVTSCRHEEATSFCLAGAYIKCYGVGRSAEWAKIVDKIRSMGHGLVHMWNDAPERTYEDVIALCKELDI